MIGPFLNGAAVIAGSVFGVSISRLMPTRLRNGLTPTFALCSMLIGVHLLSHIHFLSVVVMSLILGTMLGELMYLEAGVSKAGRSIQKLVQKLMPNVKPKVSEEDFAMQYASLIVIFCASSLGVIGALTEGLKGNYELLLIKSLMDFMTAMIFAVSLGPSIAFIAVLQFICQAALFGTAKIIMPYMDTIAFTDFQAVGGIIMLAVGLRIAKIMNFSVINFLPALVLAVPFSYLWRYFGFS